MGNGFGDGWSTTSAAVEQEYLTSPGHGDFCSVPGVNGAWVNSCGLISITVRIWRRFLKYREPDSVCTSYRLGELSLANGPLWLYARLVSWDLTGTGHSEIVVDLEVSWLFDPSHHVGLVSVLSAPPR